MTSGNRIVMVSPSSGNLSLTLDTGRHVIGLSNPALAAAEEEEAATVFVTELGPRGASIYRVTADQQAQQLLSPEGWGSFNVTYSYRMCKSYLINFNISRYRRQPDLAAGEPGPGPCEQPPVPDQQEQQNHLLPRHQAVFRQAREVLFVFQQVSHRNHHRSLYEVGGHKKFQKNTRSDIKI